MTIRARRAGRARHFQNPRAITRARFTPYPEEQEDPMRTTRDITPERLALYCEDLDDVRVRTTSDGGWLVYGPKERDGGSAVIPRTWEHGRGRENVLASLRRAGVDLSGLDPDPDRSSDDDAPTPAKVAKLRLSGPRPTLSYSKPDPAPTTEDPAVAQPAPTTASTSDVTAEDFLDALDRIGRLEDQLASLVGELADTRRELVAVRNNTPGAKEQQAQERRDRIVEWFGQLPTGFRVTAGVIYENLQVPEEERRVYGDTIRQLATDGVLTADGGLGERGGRHAQYQLTPTTQTAKAS